MEQQLSVRHSQLRSAEYQCRLERLHLPIYVLITLVYKNKTIIAVRKKVAESSSDDSHHFLVDLPCSAQPEGPAFATHGTYDI
jgi:hypothetical protein